MAGIHHVAIIVSAIAGIADALVSTGQILTFTVSAINLRILTLVHVNGTIRTGVSSALAVARKAIHSIVTLAIILAGHVTFKIRRAIIDVGLAIHAGVTERAGAFRRLFYSSNCIMIRKHKEILRILTRKRLYKTRNNNLNLKT